MPHMMPMMWIMIYFFTLLFLMITISLFYFFLFLYPILSKFYLILSTKPKKFYKWTWLW